MTVSFKRLIAFVALFAIALAGTPTKALATDGLKSDRYGFKSKEKQIEALKQTQANLNQNPFRDKTVAASLSGASIKIDRANVNESNIAVLLTKGATDNRAVVHNPRDLTEPLCQIHSPVFDAAGRDFYSGLWNAGRSAKDFAGSLYGAAMDGMEMAIMAENEFAKTVTAAAVGYRIPRTSSLNRSRLSTRSTAVIRNIQTETIPAAIQTIPPKTNLLKRPQASNISIVVLDAYQPGTIDLERPFQFGQHLLIQEYQPAQVDQAEMRPAPLAVPAIAISHRQPSSDSTSDSNARSLIRSAKAIMKSIIQAIEPMIGFQRAMLVPEQVRNQLFQIDELIWSSSNLQHIWNFCGTHK